MKKFLALLVVLGLFAPSCAKKKEPWLFVLHAREGELTKNELILKNLDEYALIFTEPPKREAKMILVKELVDSWKEAFDKTSPNASISYYSKDGKYHAVAAELINPRMEGESVVFEIKKLEGGGVARRERLGETALFIDVTDPILYLPPGGLERI